jgi:hypothetical protein
MTAWCSGHSFAGGPTWMVQQLGGDVDVDLLCPAGAASYQATFAPPRKLAVPRYVDPVVTHHVDPHAELPLEMPLLGVSGVAISNAAASLVHGKPHLPAWVKLGGPLAVLAFRGVPALFGGKHHHHT